MDEIIEAIKVLNQGGYAHKYFFAPYEATPQVVYLHDNYCGGNLMLYPDLLLYGWYNYIMDIDLANESFEWVKYRKELKLNEQRKLPTVFVKCGYYIPKGKSHQQISMKALRTILDISNEKNKCNQVNSMGMSDLEALSINFNTTHKADSSSKFIPEEDDLINLVSKACYLNTSFQIEKFKNEPLNIHEDKFEQLYGQPVGNLVLVSLFRGLLTPKMCEHLTRGSVYQPDLSLNLSCEQKYILFMVKMNDAARKAISLEESKTGTNADEDTSVLGINNFIHSKIVNEELASSSETRIKTVSFVCK